MSEMDIIRDAEDRGRTELWPLWRKVYAQGDPLPKFAAPPGRPAYRFDEGQRLPEEYKGLLLKMLGHEGERAGNKSFLGFMGTCLDIAEALFPTREMRLLKAEYLAEELKHAIMFHRLAVGLEPDFALRDVPYAHYAFHLPRETWADDAYFHFFVDLNGAFHARDWRESSYVPLAKMSATVERDERLGEQVLKLEVPRVHLIRGGATPPPIPPHVLASAQPPRARVPTPTEGATPPPIPQRNRRFARSSGKSSPSAVSLRST